MAGHFNVFRRYQKASLAGLAIMAMLAFFVLPPLLQMGGAGGGARDGLVVRWNGGGLQESSLHRAVTVRRGLNRFLATLRAVATGNEDNQPLLPDDEKSVVDAILLAREAEANGIIVTDQMINDFLGGWTGDMVTSAQMQDVIGQLRERVGVTETDIFDALRTVMLAQRLQMFVMGGAGFGSTPPGWRWDAYRKLEQGATVEVVPVVVESLSDEVSKPSTAALEKLYTQYSNDLPKARSTTPGFREPARARYDAVVAPADLFVAESEKAVTDEEIAKFYDENKTTLFKKAAEPATGTDAAKNPDAAAEKPDAEKGPDAAKEPAPSAAVTPAAEGPATPADAKPADQPAADEKAAPREGARMPTGSIRQVAFRQPSDETAAAKTTSDAAVPAAASEDKKEGAAAEEKPGEPAAEPAVKPAEEKPSDDKAADGGTKEAAPEVEPLDKVRDDIRKRLAQQAAERKVNDIFGAVTAKISAYSDDVELAIGLGEKVPPPPDVTKIAAEHGLQGIRSEFVTPAEAASAGGIGGSFQIGFSERFGVRQQQWTDLLLAPESPRFRPIVTRDVAGARYLSWKTEDRQPFTPPFAEIKSDVERVWKLLEARPLARKRAEEIAASAKGKTLAEAIAGRDGLESKTVGPFTWLTRGTAPFGSAPTLSNPTGIEMAGEALMAAVFALEPGETAVAFNEPETVCYAIRLASLEPDEDTLQARFRDTATDPRRLEMLAQDESREVYGRWIADIEKRLGITWLRPPRE